MAYSPLSTRSRAVASRAGAVPYIHAETRGQPNHCTNNRDAALVRLLTFGTYGSAACVFVKSSILTLCNQAHRSNSGGP